MDRIYSWLTEGIMSMDGEKQSGQGFLEYALILILVVMVVIAVVYLLGPTIGNLYSNIIANTP